MIEALEKRKLSSIIDEVKNTSFSEKQEIKSEEEIINSFLDRINDFKKKLLEDSDRINGISERIESVSWFEEINEETLNQLNQLIVLAKDVRGTLIRKYVTFNYFREKGIAKEEISIFKNAIDFFTESYSDIESTFFLLPKNKEFLEVTRKLLA